MNYGRRATRGYADRAGKNGGRLLLGVESEHAVGVGSGCCLVRAVGGHFASELGQRYLFLALDAVVPNFLRACF